VELPTRKVEEVPPESIPWRRVLGLLRPIRGGLAAMVGLSVGGVLVGLVPPLALGVLVNALVERGDTHEAALLTGLIAAAIVVEAAAYVASDGLYARNAGRLYRDLRLRMFDGAKRRPPGGDDESGLPSRFISDVETVERLTVSVLDVGSMMLVEFGSALVIVGLMEPLTLLVIVPMLIATWFVTRRMQEPAASAGQRRQEELERMTQSIVRDLADRDDPDAKGRFRAAAEQLLSAEIRVGWLQALNREGSAGLAKLGPIAVVVAATFAGSYRAGTLISLYLLAQRTFWGFDGLVDLSLGMQSVRGAVNRCFNLIDTPADRSQRLFLPPATTSSRRVPVGVRATQPKEEILK
jgi:ABC-type multidrug transport system fused ATPase/permease subunit